MLVLKRFAFPKITEALEARAGQVAKNTTSPSAGAPRPRRSSQYRERLKEAREQADDIVARAKRAGDAAWAPRQRRARRSARLVAAARGDIDAETKRSLEQIRKEVADLTVLATEKVARKTLD